MYVSIYMYKHIGMYVCVHRYPRMNHDNELFIGVLGFMRKIELKWFMSCLWLVSEEDNNNLSKICERNC